MGLSSLQNTVGKRNLEELERPNFGTDQMLEMGKKNHLDLKFKLEAGGCMRTARQKKKNLVKNEIIEYSIMASSGNM